MMQCELGNIRLWHRDPYFLLPVAIFPLIFSLRIFTRKVKSND